MKKNKLLLVALASVLGAVTLSGCNDSFIIAPEVNPTTQSGNGGKASAGDSTKAGENTTVEPTTQVNPGTQVDPSTNVNSEASSSSGESSESPTSDTPVADDDDQEAPEREFDETEISYSPKLTNNCLSMSQYFSNLGSYSRYGSAQYSCGQSSNVNPGLDGFNIVVDFLNYYDLFLNDNFIPSYFEKKVTTSTHWFTELIGMNLLPGLNDRKTEWDVFEYERDNGATMNGSTDIDKYNDWTSRNYAYERAYKYAQRFGLSDIGATILAGYNKNENHQKFWKTYVAANRFAEAVDAYLSAYGLKDIIKYTSATYSRNNLSRIAFQNKVMEGINNNRPVMVGKSSSQSSAILVYSYDASTKKFKALGNEDISLSEYDVATVMDFSQTEKNQAKRFLIYNQLYNVSGVCDYMDNPNVSMLEYFDLGDISYGSSMGTTYGAGGKVVTKNQYYNPYLDGYNLLPELLNYYDIYQNGDFIPSYFEEDPQNYYSFEAMKSAKKMPGFIPRHTEYECMIADWECGMGFTANSLDGRFDEWTAEKYPEDRWTIYRDYYSLYDIPAAVMTEYSIRPQEPTDPRIPTVAEFDTLIDIYKRTYGLEDVIKYTSSYMANDSTKAFSNFIMNEILGNRPVVVSRNEGQARYIAYGYDGLSQKFMCRSGASKYLFSASEIQDARTFDFSLSPRKVSYRFKINNCITSVYGDRLLAGVKFTPQKFFNVGDAARYPSVREGGVSSKGNDCTYCLDSFNAMASILNFYDLTINKNIVASNLESTEVKNYASLEDMYEDEYVPGFGPRHTLYETYMSYYATSWGYTQANFSDWCGTMTDSGRAALFAQKYGLDDIGAQVYQAINSDILNPKEWKGLRSKMVGAGLDAYAKAYGISDILKYKVEVVKKGGDVTDAVMHNKIMQELIAGRPVLMASGTYNHCNNIIYDYATHDMKTGLYGSGTSMGKHLFKVSGGLSLSIDEISEIVLLDFSATEHQPSYRLKLGGYPESAY